MHKTSLSFGCEDFEGSYEGKNCAWVAQNPNSRCDLCSENGNVCVVDYCKQTCNSCDPVKLTASDGAAYDFFGYSVAVSDDTLVVGAYLDDDNGIGSGSVYVFIGNKEKKLTASDGASNDYFGRSVAVSDNTIVVGGDSESVYVFTRNEGGNWYEQQKLSASDGESYEYFGFNVAVSEGTIVVGSHGVSPYPSYIDNVGAVYVFIQNEEGNWYEKQKLTASDGASNDNFGISVAVSDDTIVVGAYKDNVSGTQISSGSVYVFTLNEEENWYEKQKLTASDGESYDNFGISVALSDDTIVVGRYSDSFFGDYIGSVYVFTLNEEGNWYEQQKLSASDGELYDYFGKSVAVSEGTIVVGAFGTDDSTIVGGGTNSGSAYIFSLNEEGNWYQREKLTASDGECFDNFGTSVALSDDTLFVGAHLDDDKGTNSGSVYIYSV